MKIRIPEYIRTLSDKYKYILLICLVGIILITLPSGKNAEAEKTEDSQDDTLSFNLEEIEKKAQEIFSKIEGVGKTEVKISIRSGFEKEYISDLRSRTGINGDYSDSEYDNETVFIKENNREKPLLKRIIYPEFLGAVIVCDGGDDSNIRLQLTQAMRSLTGISSDNIVVAKMKK